MKLNKNETLVVENTLLVEFNSEHGFLNITKIHSTVVTSRRKTFFLKSVDMVGEDYEIVYHATDMDGNLEVFKFVIDQEGKIQMHVETC